MTLQHPGLIDAPPRVGALVLTRCQLLVDAANAAINEEAEAQRACYALEDKLTPLERWLELLRAEADILAQDGRNAEVRAAQAKAKLSENPTYQDYLRDADAIRRDLREQRVVLTVAGHMRALAFLAVRLETARLTAEGSR